MITVYTTCKDEEEAKRIAKGVLLKKLAACANLFAVGSMYWWGDAIKEEDEVAILFKTNKRFDDVKAAIVDLHSYDVPCVEKIDAKFSEKYASWVAEVLKE